MACKHRPIITNFCPDCGMSLKDDPLVELRGYLMRQLQRARRDAERYPQKEERRPQVPRWEGRLSALDTLIEQGAKNENQ